MNIERSLYEMGALDQMARQDSPMHRLDPRAKILATLGCIITAVSFPQHELSALLPLALFPVSMAALGNIPARTILRKLLIASPFALFVGMFNPIFDRAPLLEISGIAVSGGWVSFASIMLRFGLSVSSALALIAVTGFSTVCMALNRMGLPRALSVQLLFLYRYIFVLTEEGLRMSRARSLRSFQGRGMGPKVYASLLGHLLLRTMDRAERIHMAMLCRGFDGEIRLNQKLAFRLWDAAFLLGWLAFFGLVRWMNLSQWLGQLTSRMLQ